MDRANLALADWLARQGHPVRLVAYRAADSLLSLPNVSLVRVPKPGNKYLLGSPLLDRIGRFQARRARGEGGVVLVNGGNCQVPAVNWVHYVNAAFTPVLEGSLARRAKGVVSHRLFLHEERVALRMARVIIANSERTKEDILRATGVPAERVRVVYYGSDPERFRPSTEAERAEARAKLGWPEGRRTALFIGALGDQRKGFDTVFKAWERLCARPGWDVDLVAVGAGEQRAVFEQRAREEGLEERIHLLGFRKDVPDLLRASDLLVAPTRYEAYGLGVHEALCMGLPALVSRSAGVAERYPEDLRELLLPDPDDVEDLVRRVEAWSADHVELRRRVTALSANLRAWTWDDMARRIAELSEQFG
ncbi:glycosyltransferase family 4 protein [Myxococcaceae bacterium GXIMD 01537]